MTSNTAQTKYPPISYQTASSRSRDSVLVVAHGDGWLEVYAGKHVDVHVASMPFAPNTEALAERYFELCLPRKYRELYWPDLRRAMQMVEIIRPSDIALRECELALFKAIRAAFANAKDEVVAWTL